MAGISVGGCKPNFKSFLNPNDVQLKNLEDGISILFDNTIKGIKFFFTHAVMDKPAKAYDKKTITFNSPHRLNKK